MDDGGYFVSAQCVNRRCGEYIKQLTAVGNSMHK